MQTLLKRWSRLRHTRGFGVHSPFAYAFITSVLCPPRRYGYYAYSTVGRNRHMRLLVRLLAYFNPSSVGIYLAAKADMVQAVVQAVCPHAVITRDSPSFIISDHYLPELATANALILGDNMPAVLPRIQSAMAHGMTFSDGRRCAVVAALPHLPRQDFELNI